MSDANPKVAPSRNNEHIKEYLRYYFSFRHSPKYAVLLNGTWGIGKTYLIERLLEEINKDEMQYCYVSLFGASSMADIDDALLRAIHPYVFSKASKLAGHAVKAAVSYFKITSTIDIGEFVDKFKAQIYIFDDLERCEMPINRVMGYINSFVEHEGCKIVIIAHEGQIHESERIEYGIRREKIVGKTFEVQASTEDALTHFITKIDNEKAKNFASRHKNDIKIVYDESDINNLRILQQSIWDFERFYGYIPEDLATKSAGQTFIMRFFLAFSFEVKKGRISASDLEARAIDTYRMLKAKDIESLSSIEQANLRYSDIDMGDTVLSNENMVNIFVKGILDEPLIVSDLRKSKHFVQPEEEPAWRIVWDRDARDMEVVENAIAKMEEYFSKRLYEDVGEMLHVFGLRLALVDDGVFQRSRQSIFDECILYINDLRAFGKLFFHKSYSEFMISSGSYGLGYENRQSDEFQKLYRHLKEKGLDGVIATYPEKGLKLLEEMQSDPNLFWRRINYSNTMDGFYTSIPIFAYINADDFFQKFMAIDSNSQREVMLALHSRYEHGKIKSEFAEESDFLSGFSAKILDAAENAPVLLRNRLRRLHGWAIAPVLLSKDD